MGYSKIRAVEDPENDAICSDSSLRYGAQDWPVVGFFPAKMVMV